MIALEEKDNMLILAPDSIDDASIVKCPEGRDTEAL